MNTRNRKRQVNRTIKKRGGREKAQSLIEFHREITLKFLEVLNAVKLYHWKTHIYSTHKATDELYEKLNKNIDMFIEILLGKTESRIHLSNVKTLKIIELKKEDDMKTYMNAFKTYLVSLNNNKAMKLMHNSDLYNIRDEILADVNQYLYLATLS